MGLCPIAFKLTPGGHLCEVLFSSRNCKVLNITGVAVIEAADGVNGGAEMNRWQAPTKPYNHSWTAPKARMSQAGEFRHLVRVAGKDLDGSKKLVVALSDLKGVGYNFAVTVVNRLGLDPRARLGTLTEEQVHEVEKALHNAHSMGIPEWFFNRRKDPESGESKQLIGSDLDFVTKRDIENERNIQSWRGIRHGLGLKVRGQRTRTTGRKGRTVGVRKAAIQAAAKASEQKEEK